MDVLIFLMIACAFCIGFYYLARILREVRRLKVDQIEILQRLEYLTRKFQAMDRSGEMTVPRIPEPQPSIMPHASAPVEPPPIPTASLAVGSDTPPPVAVPPPYAADGREAWKTSTPKIVEDAGEILKKMWSWILVGEEFRKPNVSAEIAIASTWLLRMAVFALVSSAGFLMVYWSECNILPPEARIALIFAGGGAVIWGGFKLLGRKYNLIGQGLMGAGLLTLYLGAYMSGPSHDELFGQHSATASFALMVAVALLSAVLAVRTDSLLSAILGIAGAFGAPLLLATAAVNYTSLFGYMLILNLAVLAIALKKEWRLLNYLAFILTYILFALSLDDYVEKQFLVVILFLGLFFVVHSSLVFLRSLIDEKESTVLEVVHMTANALFFAFFAYDLIDGRFGRPYPAVMTSLLAAFYAVHAYVFLKKSLVDRRLMIAFSALACFFLSLTLPVVMDKASLTMGFALLALMFLWLGRKIESNFIQSMGNALYTLVFMRLLWGLGTGFLGDPSRKMDFGEYSVIMLERLWKYGVSVASLIGACIIQKSHIGVRHDFAVTQENDVPEVIKRNVASDILYWTGVMCGFMFVLLELNCALSYFKPMRQTMLTGLWVCMGLYFLWSYIAFRKRDAFAISAMNAFALVALIKLVFLDLAGWRLNHLWVYGSSYEVFEASMRAVDFAVVILMFVVIWRLMRSRSSWLPAPVFGYGSAFLLLLYATLELNSFLYFKLRVFQYGGISVLWAVFAVAFIGVGIWKNLKLLRYSGLALFALVAFKVPLLDLASMEVLHRVLAFLVIGLALLGGSFAYLHSGRKRAKKG